MPNKWRTVKELVLQGGYKKLLNPTVAMHLTAYPKTAKDQEKLGVRFDYAGAIIENGKKVHRYQVQVNAGDKIPKSWKIWREKHSKGKGTHAIVATIKVPDSGTKDDVAKAFDDVEDQIE